MTSKFDYTLLSTNRKKNGYKYTYTYDHCCGNYAQIIGIYDTRCNSAGTSKCKCRYGDFPEIESKKVIKINKEICPILKNKLNDKPKWIKLLKFKKELNKINYLCFVAYNFDNPVQLIDKIYEQFELYKTKKYYRELLGKFSFPHIAVKVLNLLDSNKQNNIYDNFDNALGKKCNKTLISNIIFNLDAKGEKEEPLPAHCPPPRPKEGEVRIYPCRINCQAETVSKEHPCYVCIFHENREGELTFDLGF